MSDDVLVFQEPSVLQLREEVTGDFIIFNTTEFADPVVVAVPGDILVFTEPSTTAVQVQYSSGAVFVLTSGGPPGPPGPPGPSDWVTEHPVGPIDAVNENFITTYDFVPGTTRVYLNGMRQNYSSSYTESGTHQLDLSFAPWPGDELIVDYLKA